MSSVSFVMPETEFSAAAQAVARRVLRATAAPSATKPPHLRLITRTTETPASDPSPFERLSAALEKEKSQPGYREVARYVTSAQNSPGEHELSAMRTNAVIAGLAASIQRRQPATVPA